MNYLAQRINSMILKIDEQFKSRAAQLSKTNCNYNLSDYIEIRKFTCSLKENKLMLKDDENTSIREVFQRTFQLYFKGIYSNNVYDLP
ncbi:MAG: hypothetical protein ACFFDW_06115 [Candidatus Thorarchaeota archaeon]